MFPETYHQDLLSNCKFNVQTRKLTTTVSIFRHTPETAHLR